MDAAEFPEEKTFDTPIVSPLTLAIKPAVISSPSFAYTTSG